MKKHNITKSCSNCELFTWKRSDTEAWGFCTRSQRHLPIGGDLTTLKCNAWKERQYNE